MGKKVFLFLTAYLFSIIAVFMAIMIGYSFSVALSPVLGGIPSSFQATVSGLLLYCVGLWFFQDHFSKGASLCARIAFCVVLPTVIFGLLAPFSSVTAAVFLGLISVGPFYQMVTGEYLKKST